MSKCVVVALVPLNPEPVGMVDDIDGDEADMDSAAAVATAAALAAAAAAACRAVDRTKSAWHVA